MRPSKLLSVIICAIMLLSLASCDVSKGTSWVYEVDSEQISAGLYLLYQQQSLTTAVDKITEDITAMENEKDENGEDYEPTDTEFPAIVDNLDSYTIEDVPAKQWIEEDTLNNVKKYVLAKKLVEDNAVVVPLADVQSGIDSAAQQFSQYKDSYEYYGIGQESIKEAAIADAKLNAVFATLFKGSGEYAPSESEVKEFFEENYAYTFWFNSSIEDFSDEDVETVEEAFDAFLDALNNDEDFLVSLETYKGIYDVIFDSYNEDDADEETDAENDVVGDGDDEETDTTPDGISSVDDEEDLTTEEGDDQTDAENESEDEEEEDVDDIDNHSTVIRKDDTTSVLPDEILEVIWDQDPKTAKYEKVVAEDGSLHIVKRRELSSNPDNLKNYKSSIEGEIASERFPEIIEEKGNELPVNTNERALKKYGINTLLKKLEEAQKQQAEAQRQAALQ